MANKKISELVSRTPSLTDLMLVGDPSSGYSYKCTITALATVIETDIADGYVTLASTQTISGAKIFSNVVTLSSVANASTDTDKFLVLTPSNFVNYRTGAEVLADIGGADDSLVVHKAGTETITGLKTFNAGLTLPNYVPINLSNSARIEGYDGKVLFRTVFGAAGWFQDNSLYLAQTDNITTGYNIGVLVKDYTGEGKVGYKTPAQMLTYLGAQGTLTLTTTGTSGAATLVGNTLNIPQYQAVLTDPVTGTGTTNYIPKFTGTSSIGNSVIYETGGNIGIGTTTPVSPLDVVGKIRNNGSNIDLIKGGTTGQTAINFGDASSADVGQILYDHDNNLMRFGVNDAERMRITSAGNLGIGTSAPSVKLHVLGAGEVLRLEVPATTGNYLAYNEGSTRIAYVGRGSGSSYNFNVWNTQNADMLFGTNNTERMRLDASGNLGLGVTPSAWESGFRIFQIGNTGVLANNTSDLRVILNSNSFNNSAGATTYLANGFASSYMQISGQHRWYNAPNNTSGAGAALTFTQAMTLNASGDLGLGTTSPVSAGSGMPTLDIAGASTKAATLWLHGNGTTTNTTGFQIQHGTNSLAYLWNFSNTAMAFATNNTERMRLDASGNLGLGVTPSAWGSTIKAIQANNASLYGVTTDNSNATIAGNAYYDGTGFKYIATQYAQRYTQSGGQHLWFTAPSGTAGTAISFTQAMTLDASGNLGIGTTSPAYTFHTVSSSTSIGAFRNSGAANGQLLVGNTAGDLALRILASGDALIFSDASKYLAFGTNGGTERMRLDVSGNLGLGVTPSAWGSGTRAFETTAGSIYSFNSGNLHILQNAYYDGTNWVYKNSAASTRYQLTSGQHIWYNAPSGTAGTAISFTQAMTLDASGNLGVGTTSPTARLTVSAGAVTARFQSGSATDGRVEWAYNTTDVGYIGTPTSTEFSVWARTGNALLFGAGNTERMRITSGGNVLVGTTTDIGDRMYVNGSIRIPSATFFRYDGDIGLIGSGSSISGGTVSQLGIRAANDILFATNGINERMRITSAGNVGIGTTSPTSYGVGYNTLEVSGSTSGVINVSTGSTVLGQLSNGTNQFKIDAVGASSSLLFLTNTNEKMRLTSAGELLINTTTDAGDFKLQVSGNAYTSGNVNALGFGSFGRNVDGSYRLIVRGQGVTSSTYGFAVQDNGGNQNFWVRDDGVAYLRGNVGIGTTSPSSSALLDVSSTTQGFLPPRMTGAQAEAIATPADGLLVYINNGNGTTITSTGFWGYSGGWVKLN